MLIFLTVIWYTNFSFFTMQIMHNLYSYKSYNHRDLVFLVLHFVWLCLCMIWQYKCIFYIYKASRNNSVGLTIGAIGALPYGRSPNYSQQSILQGAGILKPPLVIVHCQLPYSVVTYEIYVVNKKKYYGAWWGTLSHLQTDVATSRKTILLANL